MLLLFTSAGQQSSWPLLSSQPGLAVVAAVGLYLAYLIFIWIQNKTLQHYRWWSKARLSILVQLELLLYFTFIFFAIGAQRLPMMIFTPFSQTGVLACSLTLYFLGLSVHELSFQRRLKPFKKALSKALSDAAFILPFAAPFALFVALDDTIQLMNPSTSFLNTLFIIIIDIITLLAAFIFLPPLAILLWRCPRLKDEALNAELNALCERAKFSHAGFRIWQAMNASMTAAIIGALPPFRTILFTQKLLDTLPRNAVKAVLAHEIGHHHHRHLLIYPFILFGMVASASVIGLLLYPYFAEDINGLPQAAFLIGSFIFYAVIMGAYFRFVFGYFSRLFERQADLYVSKLGLPSEDMVLALDTLGTACGNIHRDPNWHHYSIQERIDFLQEAQQNPEIIRQHHQKVKYSLIAYTCFLTAVAAYLIAQIFFIG